MSLTHLLIRYTSDGGPLGEGSIAAVTADLPGRVNVLAHVSPSLRWFGMDNCGGGLRSWEISRPQTGSATAAAELRQSCDITLTELSEWAGRRVLQEEQMEIFASVDR